MLLQFLLPFGPILHATAVVASKSVPTVGMSPVDWADAGSVLGVNTHNPMPIAEVELDLLQRAGFRWIRTDVSWASIETRSGVYNFSSADYNIDAFFKQLSSRNIGWVAILSDSNPVYGAAAGIGHLGLNATDGQRSAYSRFAQSIAQRYSTSNQVLWELVNEPNTGGGYERAPLYAAVAYPAARAIRSVGGQVAAPAVANIDFSWLQELFELGLGDVTDVLTCHPYRGDAPETFLPNAAALSAMIKRYTPINASMRLSVGEVGYSYGAQNPTDATPIDATTQAHLVVRVFLTALAAEARPAIWYDWKSAPLKPGCSGSQCGEHMGIIDANRQPLPGYHAVRTLNTMISGMEFQSKVGVCHTDPCITTADDFALTFKNASHLLVVAWSVTSFNHSASLKFTRGCWHQFDWMGKVLPDVCPRGNLDRRLAMDTSVAERYINVYLSSAPLYLLQTL